MTDIYNVAHPDIGRINLSMEGLGEAIKAGFDGDIGIAAQEFRNSMDNPQGLVLGEMFNGTGVGYRMGSETSVADLLKDDKTTITTLSGTAGAFINDAGTLGFGVEAMATAYKNLGDGYYLDAKAVAGWNTIDGVNGQASAEAGFINSSDVDIFGVQSWQVSAGVGTYGSSDNVCAAVGGDLYVGNNLTQVFIRGAAGTCTKTGPGANLTTGVALNLNEALSGSDFGDIIPKNTLFEVGGQYDTQKGPEIVAGLKINF